MPGLEAVATRMPGQRSSLSARSVWWPTIGECVIEAHGDDVPDADWSGPGESGGAFVRWIPRCERSPDRLWTVLEWRAHGMPVVDIAVLIGVPEARVRSWLTRNAREARKERLTAALMPRSMRGETT
ncbi:hypothetical protein DMH01_15015 [Amycolatopsis sp. WAC 04182]|uniref:sigma-70 family RNA polymerase sigma factor n=1 Tax=Amycolatopsis sp. WAC 04182 TaxID=2203198 RepID=UPI000F785F94|nr:sigma-70 family RNA polymerase sigma factor [Amycolatopsis sp. WAC 04182]RSN60608.1 hypothetical protein DMH01_15015 [Amycolatopsis sp. WAC 04182]